MGRGRVHRAAVRSRTVLWGSVRFGGLGSTMHVRTYYSPTVGVADKPVCARALAAWQARGRTQCAVAVNMQWI